MDFGLKQTLVMSTCKAIQRVAIFSLMVGISFNTNHAWSLELNIATEAELDSLKGMGPSLSRKVLAARKAQLFSSWADFRQRVSGIGTAKAKQFSEQGLTVQGQSFSSAVKVSD